MGGCSKDDDGPSKGSNVEGSAKVDGKTINLRYGYAYYGSSYTEYYFYDKDMMKYIDKDIEDIDVEFSSLWIDYDTRNSEIEGVAIEYKINAYKGKGTIYEYHQDDADISISYSIKNNTVSFSSKSIPLDGYLFDSEDCIGTFKSSFSVEGKVKDISDLDDDYYSTRSIEIVEVTDAKQISFLRSLVKKHGNMANRK